MRNNLTNETNIRNSPQGWEAQPDEPFFCGCCERETMHSYEAINEMFGILFGARCIVCGEFDLVSHEVEL